MFDVFYMSSVVLSKASVVLFYNRIFTVGRGFLIFTRGILALLAASWIVSLILQAYDAPMLIPGVHLSLFAMLILNIAADLVIFGIIQFQTWRLRLSTKTKVWLSLLFFLGML